MIRRVCVDRELAVVADLALPPRRPTFLECLESADVHAATSFLPAAAASSFHPAVLITFLALLDPGQLVLLRPGELVLLRPGELLILLQSKVLCRI